MQVKQGDSVWIAMTGERSQGGKIIEVCSTYEGAVESCRKDYDEMYGDEWIQVDIDASLGLHDYWTHGGDWWSVSAWPVMT